VVVVVVVVPADVLMARKAELFDMRLQQERMADVFGADVETQAMVHFLSKISS
jgi:hypothetical protein